MAFGPGLALALILARGPGEARLTWEAPLACPRASWLEARVDAYLGHAFTSEAEVEVAGYVHADSAGFVLELVTLVGGVREQRQLTHHDCDALVEIAASLAAIVIDPLALPQPLVAAADPRAAPPSRAPVPIQRPQTRPSASPPTSPPPDPEPSNSGSASGSAKPLTAEPPFELHAESGYLSNDRERRGPTRDTADQQTRMLVSASGGLALNLFPNPAPQVRAGVGVQHGGPRSKLRVALEGGAALGGRFRSVDGAAGGDLTAWDISLRPCGVPRWGIVELRVCAAVGAGQIRARGVGVEPARTLAHPWVWLALDPGLAVELHTNLAVFLDLGADFSIYRPNFSISGPDAAYATPIVAGHGRLGVELRFF
ncbi:hypothetical protein [Enhygromyxa salina]|uniref:Uncharacterized protein n=1 Tax=Enhygromyxa salina TaxID=215803 RepID=A0A2S9YNI0_9BACT|nr:hypothetical protein [Enhygromyxa salina]PRQ06653.1 hypothetical protein ENSA7_35290 [Enhygromyxa salina]